MMNRISKNGLLVARPWLFAVTLAVLSLLTTARTMADEAKPAEAAKPAAKITYDEHVRPIFREHCFSCHNQDTKKSDLSLASFAGAMQGGSTGAIISAGDPDSSRLWQLVSHAEEPKMPPNQDKLPAAKLDMIKGWIAGGASRTTARWPR